MEGTKILSGVKGKAAGIALKKVGNGEVILVGISPGTDAFTHLRHSSRAGMTINPGKIENVFAAVLDYGLGSRKPLTFQRDFSKYQNVEATLLEESPRIKTLFMINYEDDPVSVEVGVPDLPEGKYTVVERYLTPTQLVFPEKEKEPPPVPGEAAEEPPSDDGLQEIMEEIIQEEDAEKIKTEIPKPEKKLMLIGRKQFAYEGKSVFQAEDLKRVKLEIPSQGVRILHIAPDDYQEPSVDDAPVTTRGFFLGHSIPTADSRKKLIEQLTDLAANQIITSTMGRELRYSDEQFRALLDDFHEHGIMVGANDLAYSWDFWNEEQDGLRFPYCVNGMFREVWGEQLAKIAKYPFDSISIVPDEWCWSNRHIGYCFGMYWMKQAQEFLQKIAKESEYCYCENCTELFRKRYGIEPPRQAGSPDWKLWTQFRYDSTADAVRHWADIVKKINPSVKTTTLYGIHPVMSYQASKWGIAWDQIGYSADLDIAGTDPYVILHDGWRMRISINRDHYVRLVTKFLLGSNKKRQAEITLQASRLRDHSRDIKPVEVYGNALSVIAHGARRVLFFKFDSVNGKLKFVKHPEGNFVWCEAAFSTMKDIGPWIANSRVPKRIAFIYSRLADDWTHPMDPSKYWFHQRILYFLFDRGYPFDLYYLEQLTFDQIKDYQVLVIPHVYIISEGKKKVLEQALEQGARIVLFPELGGEANMYPRRKTKEALMKYEGKEDLRAFAGIKGFGPKIFGALKFHDDSPILTGKEIMPLESSGDYSREWKKTDTKGGRIFFGNADYHSGKSSLRIENPDVVREVILKIALKGDLQRDAFFDFDPRLTNSWQECVEKFSVSADAEEKKISVTLSIERVGEGIALKQSNISLETGRTYKFGAWIKNEGTTTWIDDLSLTPVRE
ncbi:beta-galactosidase [Verrucomicrobiota bacterium]